MAKEGWFQYLNFPSFFSFSPEFIKRNYQKKKVRCRFIGFVSVWHFSGVFSFPLFTSFRRTEDKDASVRQPILLFGLRTIEIEVLFCLFFLFFCLRQKETVSVCVEFDATFVHSKLLLSFCLWKAPTFSIRTRLRICYHTFFPCIFPARRTRLKIGAVRCKK